MRRATVLLSSMILVLVVLWVQSLVAHAAGPLNAEIVERSNVYLKAVQDGNAVAVASMFRDDAVEMPPCQRMVQGRLAIEKFYRDMLNGPVKVTGFSFDHLESSVAGEVAFDIGTYKQTISTPGGPVEDTGKYTAILKRTAGEWKVAYLIYNSDFPPKSANRTN